MPPRKTNNTPSRPSYANSSHTFPQPATSISATEPPTRAHSLHYHYALLLQDEESCDALLKWFDGVREERSMPWRKEWVDPGAWEGGDEELGSVLARRAYEVWVSEVMLQQTRVSTVIPYFNTWISKWPTIQDLATANEDEIMAAWKGLGYYSRATRLQAGAQAVLSEYPNTVCPIPSTATELQKFPGVGRYTAGAISSIVFGGAEPLLDGNFIRVLSRQLGLHADPKERKVTEALWQVADLLVKRVSNFPMVERSNVPGRWNQAVMELGSTVCTPRPKCGECPIQKTCRAYAEGSLLAEKKKKMKDEDEDEDDMQDVPDIEDACTLCSEIDIEALALRPSFGEANDQEGEKLSEFKEKRIRPKKEKPKPPAKLISAYFAPQTRAYPRYPPFPTSISTSTSTTDAPLSKKRKKRSSDENRTTSDENANENIHITAITAYAALFPIRTHKKKVRESEVVVCVIELQPPPSQPNKPSRYLIEQRPAKGLLASLWQFPQSTITEDSTAATRKSIATKFVTSVKFKKGEQGVGLSTAVYVREVGDLMHVFSHLKLRMWVQLFRVEGSADDEDGLPFSLVMPGDGPRRKWVEGGQMGGETLSTGMRRCWEIVEGVDGGGGQDAEYEDA